VSATRDWQVTEMAIRTPLTDGSLRPAAEMLVVFDGITRSLPFLLVR